MTNLNSQTVSNPGADDLLVGWDMAYVTSLSAMNAALAQQGLWPQAIRVAAKDQPTLVLTATVSDVRLAVDSEAMGGVIVLQIDLSDVALSDGSAKLPTASFRANAELEILTDPSKDARLPADLKSCPLMLKKLTGRSSVILQDPNDDDLTLALQLGAIQPLLQVWLDNELMDLAWTFASTIPGLSDLTKGKFGWALPASLAYAVGIPTIHDGKLPEEKDCVFALLGLNDTDRLESLVPQIRPDCLPAGTDACYIMSSPLFLSTVLAPAILAALHATGSPRMVVQGDGVTLSNIDEIALPDLDLSSDNATSIFVQTGKNVRIAEGCLKISINVDKLHVAVSPMEFQTSANFEDIQLNFSFDTTIETDETGRITLALPTSYQGFAQMMMTNQSFEYERWSKLVAAVITAALTFIPGGSAEAGVETTVASTSEQIVVTATTDAETTTAEEAAAVTTQADSELTGEATTKVSSLASVLGKKIGITVACSVAQEFITNFPQLLTFYQSLRHASDIENWQPTLNAICQNLADAAWFGADGKSTVKCVGASFSDGLIIHLQQGRAA